MNERLSRASLWALAGILAVGLIVPFASAGAVPAFAQPNPSNPPQSWAYGASWGATLSLNGSAISGGVSYGYQLEEHAALTWNVIFTQTNTSSSAFTINATRTLGAEVYIQGCSPSCSTPVATYNITAVGWEQDFAWANFTTTGSVLLNGTTAVPAVALQNEYIHVVGNLTATENWKTRTASGNIYYASAVEAQATAAFTPALGLFPMNMTVGQHWASSAAYTASGSYSKACHAYASNYGVATCNASGSLTGAGTVTVVGADTAWGVVVPGRSYPFHVVTLAIATGATSSYQFDASDGIFLLPQATNQFSSGATSTSADSTAATGFSATTIDVQNQGGHVGIAAAQGQLSTSASTGSLASLGAVGASAPAAIAPQDASSAPQSIQATPEGVGQAQGEDACIVQASTCSGISPAVHNGLFFVLIVGIIAVAVVVAVVASRRRGSGRAPLTPTTMIPAHTVAKPGSSPAPPSGGAPEPSNQDPLSNLW